MRRPESFGSFQVQFVPFRVRCTKSAVLRVSGHAAKFPWTFHVRRNALRAAIVQKARSSKRITYVFPSPFVPVTMMDVRMILGRQSNQLVATNGESLYIHTYIHTYIHRIDLNQLTHHLYHKNEINKLIYMVSLWEHEEGINFKTL